MESKFADALACGREYMLAKVANLPIPSRRGPDFIQCASVANCEESEQALRQFYKRFGELSPGMDPGVDPNQWYAIIIALRSHWWYWRKPQRDSRHRRPLSVSVQLRGGKTREISINDMDDASAWATGILNRNSLAIEVDFSSGRISVKPQTLLDWLVLSLIECRRNLSVCANKGCRTPFFVKPRSRSRYCSEPCSTEASQNRKRRWEKANRGVGKKR